MFHLLTQNMIKAFKFLAQAIFSLFEKTPPWFTKFEFGKFFSLFYIISTQISYTHQTLDTNSCFAKLRANSYLFSFFYTPCSKNLMFMYVIAGSCHACGTFFVY
jgi:hypothetical protein